MTNNKNERRDITIEPLEIERIVKEYYEQLDADKFDNSVEMTHSLLKLAQMRKVIWIGICLLKKSINN